MAFRQKERIKKRWPKTAYVLQTIVLQRCLLCRMVYSESHLLKLERAGNEEKNRHSDACRVCLDGDLGSGRGTACWDVAFHGYDGKLVKNLNGKNVGKIKDLVISWRSDGYIEYAVLSTDGFWGLEDEYSIAVPWGALTLSDNKEHFVLNVKEEHLKDAPGFMVYRFYDRSSAVAYRGDRSPVVSSASMMRGDIKSDVNVSVARSFDMPHVMAAEVHRR